MSPGMISLSVVALYLLLILGAGVVAHRRQAATREDYFVASRTFGPILLLLSLTGTILSAFAMLGAPGAAYHVGIGMFWMVAGSLSITFPLLFMFLGVRIWRAGVKHGYVTPIQLFIDRFASVPVGMLVFAVMTVYTVPYIVLGQFGAGLALQNATRGHAPFWVGSLVVTLVVGIYVWQGGMRGTAFTNAVQVLTFLFFLVIALFAVSRPFGGMRELSSEVLATRPELLQRGSTPQTSITASLLQMFTFSFAVLAFPHVLSRLLAARSQRVIRTMSMYYPLGFLLAYVPIVVLAVWGAVAIPDLAVGESDNILLMLVGQFTTPLVAGLAMAALLAMIMSSMDAQVLSLASLFSVDIVERFWPSAVDSSRRSLLLGRAFVALLLTVGFVVSLLPMQSLLFVANIAFTGYGALFPVIVGALYSRRLNAAGAIAAIVTGSVLTPLAILGIVPLGPLPSLPIVAIETLVMLVVTALTRAPDPERATLPERLLPSPRAGSPDPAAVS